MRTQESEPGSFDRIVRRRGLEEFEIVHEFRQRKRSLPRSLTLDDCDDQVEALEADDEIDSGQILASKRASPVGREVDAESVSLLDGGRQCR